jgi:multicomponent Na+:H+ antiporter subunit E
MHRSRQQDDRPGARSGAPKPGKAALVSAVLGRFAVFAVLWWLLTDGRADGLIFGLCCAALAALLPLVMDDPRTSASQPGLLPTLLRLPLLVPFFLWQSLRGGVDVALRAFRPRLPLAPAMIVYPLRLPPGPAPVLMASLVSLMPGTLAMISGTRLRVHVLDENRPYRDDLDRLERRVARVFGIVLAEPKAESRDPS